MRINDKNLIRVIIVDDHPIILYGMSKLLENEENIHVCGLSSNADDAVKLITKENPDVVIIDINLNGQASGLELVKAIKQRFPMVMTLILSIYDQNVYAERAIRAGALGYISKNKAPKHIVQAIQTVASGNLYLEKDLSDKIIYQLFHGRGSHAESSISMLTDRELEIFRLLGQGFETSQIARLLNLSKNTIESHRRNIKEKLRVESKNSLVVIAAQWLLSQCDS